MVFIKKILKDESTIFFQNVVVIRNRKKNTKMDVCWLGPLKVVKIILNEVVTEDTNGIPWE
jgi:hypothetical protein